jgi:hypothetical protein
MNRVPFHGCQHASHRGAKSGRRLPARQLVRDVTIYVTPSAHALIAPHAEVCRPDEPACRTRARGGSAGMPLASSPFVTQRRIVMGVVTKKRHDKKIAVFGLFRDEDTLGRAIDALKVAGHENEDISALLPDLRASKQLAHEKHTKAPEGAAVGATAGVITGGTVGLLLGIGAIVIPGLGAFVAAGPIMAALAGAGAGGAVGTLTGALIGMGIPEYEAKRYESFVNEGGMLVSVHCDSSDEARRARAILDGFGGHDIGHEREVSARRDAEHRRPR